MTNYKRILKMNMAEMANFLQNESMCSHCNYSKKVLDEYDDISYECNLDNVSTDCLNGCYKWLNSMSK